MTMTATALQIEAVESVRPASKFERVPCYYCQATETVPFLTAQDDLTGKPGTFTFITCARCGL
ncbi:MAG: hypothetical protein WAM70_15865, partial [Pyrinomonadaceae bacterium]